MNSKSLFMNAKNIEVVRGNDHWVFFCFIGLEMTFNAKNGCDKLESIIK